MNKVNQQQLNQVFQEHYSSHISEQLSQKTAKELKKQRENLRVQTFFTPIQFPANINHNDNVSNPHSEYTSVFNTLITADFLKVKDVFINEVNKFIDVTKYFAENKYTTNLKTLISRIDNEKEPKDKSKLIDHLRCCVLSLHDLTLVLNNLKYQLEQNKTSTKNIFNKDTITSYLDACIVDLDKCWAGISSRFTHEYNCLSSLNGGISGRINIIKKELLDALLSEYLNAKKQEDPDLFIVGNEIHIRNTLNNAMHEILGIDKIEDPLAGSGLPNAIKQEFIELATIEISPARIISILADSFYQDLTMILDKYSMNSWLTEYKSDDQILPDLLNELHAKFFDKINILFEADEENKLNLNSLLDFLETEKEAVKHYLYQSREKIHRWIAKRLIPDTETVFIKDIANGLAIWSIDYMFFGVAEIADNNNYSNPENYIRLQLSHLQDIDFINFTDVETGNNCYLSDHKEKITTSITLVTQAMEQTDDAQTIVNFFLNADNIKKLNELPLLKTKVKNILISKLINPSFKQQFFDTIIELIKNNYEFNPDEIYYLLSNSTCNDSLIAIIKQEKPIDDLLENIDIKYLDNITIEVFNKISDKTKKTIFKKAVNTNNCELIYQFLCASGCNKYTAYNDITNNKNLFALAIKYNHIKLVELLLQDKTLNITDYNLYDSFYNGRCEIISLCIKHILANKAKFTNDTLIKHLQANSINGCPGLYVALQNGHKKTITEYINAILNIDIDGVTVEQKLDLIKAKSEDGCPGLFLALQQGHEKTVTAYINAILNIDGITIEQKLKLIEAKSEDGFPGLYIALQKGYEKIVIEYINVILNINIDGVTIEQKLDLIKAKSEDGYPGLYVALQNGHEKTVTEYINAILNIDLFSVEQKLDIIAAKIEDGFSGLYVALHNGHEKAVTEYINAILNIDGVTAEQKLDLIEAKNLNDCPGLYVALQKGHEKAVTEYINALLNIDLFSVEQKLDIIAAKKKNGCPGLYVALQNGHEQTVTAYINAILNIDIDGVTIEQKLKLIEAKNDDGFPGLFQALYNGHEKTVTEYIKTILNTDKLTNEQKLKLIEAKTDNGFLGLYIALQNGHEKAVTEYINAILNIDGVTIEQKLKLIEAKNDNGFLGLYVALQNGHEQTVTAYINAILNIDGVTIEQKLKLIEAKNLNDCLGLYVALQNGQKQTVTAYIETILNTDKLTNKQKLKLIEAKNDDGFPGLYVALENGHKQTVTEYINLILVSDEFTTEQKLKLIQTKNKNGYLGLYLALKNGHEKTVTEYFKVIASSKKLTLEQKAMLFTAISKKNLVLYTELVNNSDLTVEEKHYLLKINSSNCTIL